jgi:hypothetical protein
MLVFTLGHEQLPPAYSFAERPGTRQARGGVACRATRSGPDAAAEARRDDLVDQALAVVAKE